ncbi:MAG: glycoside hydrolase family 3 N-terminal domain-containing protein [Caldilineaceae bacterium]
MAQTLRPDLNERPLSLRQKIGQMLLVGFNGAGVGDSSVRVRDILDYGVGGVVLFGQNVGWPQQVTELTTALQTASYRVTGLRRSSSPRTRKAGAPAASTHNLAWNRTIPRKPSAHWTMSNAPPPTPVTWPRASSRWASTSILPPVVDLNTNPYNPVIGALARSFSADPAVVARQAGAFIHAHADEGLLCTLKHFPGHGSSRQDSHYGFVDVTQTWRDTELDPYRTLIDTGDSDAIMTAHIFNANLDAQLPATLSPTVITDLLRGDLGYGGLIFTDDLQMNAIRAYYTFEEAVRLAVLAGVDVLSISNTFLYQRDAVAIAVAVIEDMVTSGRITEARIETSFQRIVRAKTPLADLIFDPA